MVNPESWPNFSKRSRKEGRDNLTSDTVRIMSSAYNPVHSIMLYLIPEIKGLALIVIANGSKARAKGIGERQLPCPVPHCSEKEAEQS